MAINKEIVRQFFIPKVSVIIPVYKVEKYLRKCLDSVISQTLRDIEIICVNDCSPDNSQAILDEYSIQDTRFILLKHEQNKGLSGARNSGLAVAKGTYIYFIDSDDFLADSNSLETLYKVAISDEADEVIGGILKWYEDNDEKCMDWHENYLKKEVHGQSLENLPQLWANVVACNKLIRRSLLTEHSIHFNENIRKHEDNPFSVQVHILAKMISIVTKTTYIYRQVQIGSIMSTIKKSDAFNRCLYCYDIFNFIEADKKRHIFRKMFFPRYSRHLIGSAEILARFNPSESEKLELFQTWKKIADLLPDHLPRIPLRQRRIFEYIKIGNLQKAWTQSLEFAAQNNSKSSTNIIKNTDAYLQKNGSHVSSQNTAQFENELSRLKDLNKTLSKRIEIVRNSYSWRITAPLRACLRLLRGYL